MLLKYSALSIVRDLTSDLTHLGLPRINGRNASRGAHPVATCEFLCPQLSTVRDKGCIPYMLPGRVREEGTGRKERPRREVAETISRLSVSLGQKVRVPFTSTKEAAISSEE